MPVFSFVQIGRDSWGTKRTGHLCGELFAQMIIKTRVQNEILNSRMARCMLRLPQQQTPMLQQSPAAAALGASQNLVATEHNVPQV